MYAQSLRTDLENIFTLTLALRNAHGMENIRGVDGSEVKDQNGGNDSGGAVDHTTSHDTL
jgi:hypothetical protein